MIYFRAATISAMLTSLREHYRPQRDKLAKTNLSQDDNRLASSELDEVNTGPKVPCP